MKNKLVFFSLIIFFCGCFSIDNLPDIYNKAVKDYQKKLLKDPNNINLRIRLANFYYKFNEFEKAKDLLVDLEKKEAQILLAKVLFKLKDYVSALEIFEKNKDIEDEEYLYLYALTLEEQKLYPNAIEIYKKIKGFYRNLAEERIKDISIKIKEGIPHKIKDLIERNKDFISNIKKEEAVIILVDEKIEVKDNASLAEVYVVQKVLKEKGKNLAEVELNYDSTYERIELEYARTITPSGKVVYAGKENIRDVSKYLNFPLYSNARAFIISMPSVEVGSIIEYKAKIYSSKLINGKDFSIIYRIKEIFPIAEAKFKLIVPKERNLKIKFFNEKYIDNIKFSPKIEELDNKKIYYWEFKNLEAIVPEANMPPFSEVNPSILISSFDTWKDIYDWWLNLYKDKIVLDDYIKNFLNNLIKSCKDDLEKIKKIYEFCAKDIRYVAVEYGDSGYEPHKATDIFWNRYGDCKDKSILLVSLLKEAGFSAFPVLIPTKEVYDIDKEYPSINFNHAICAIMYKDQLIFADPTSSTTSFFDLPPDDQDRNVLVFFDDGYKILKTPLIRENKIVYDTIINIKENEDAYLKRRVSTTGFFSSYQRYYFKNTHPDIVREDLEKKISFINPYSQLIEYNIKNLDDFDKPFILKYKFKSKKFLNPAKNLRVIPSIFDIDIDVGYFIKEERNYPLEFFGIFEKISKLKIYFPENFEVKYLPQNKEIDSNWFYFLSIYNANKNFIEREQKFLIKKRTIPKEEYKDFKKALEEVLYLLKEEVILYEKQNKKEKF